MRILLATNEPSRNRFLCGKPVQFHQAPVNYAATD